jgi:transposase-like protein
MSTALWKYRLAKGKDENHYHLVHSNPNCAQETAVLLPEPHWGRIRTANGLDRIKEELKKKIKILGAFPSDQSRMRLSILIQIDIEKWITAKIYLWMSIEI